MAYYDEQNFSQMQLDALARMRQMQQRSKSLVQEPTPSSDCPKPEPKQEIDIAMQENRPINRQNNHHKPQNNANILTNLFSSSSGIDPERLLIILMLYILYKNKADIKLLIALGYLLI